MLDERPKLSKNTEFLKIILDLINAKRASIKVPENLGHWYRDSEIISSFNLEVLLTLARCWMDTPNYRQNLGFLENYSKI